MKWPLVSPSVRRVDLPLYNLYYLHASGVGQTDPTMLWGTDVEVAPLQAYLRQQNQSSPVLISTAHVLLRATAVALARHPELNRRAVGRRVYAYRHVNVRMAFHNPRRGEVDVVLVERADERSLAETAGIVWKHLIEGTLGGSSFERDRRRLHRLPALAFHALIRFYGWLDRMFPLPTLGRLDRLRAGAVLVNDLSFRGAPSMRCYKPTRFPDESATLNVTLGPMEEKTVVRNGEIVASTVAPLFVRADHRITDAYGLGRFLATLREMLEDPARMESQPRATTSDEGGPSCQAA